MIGRRVQRPDIDQLHWDSWNSQHIVKHSVTTDEVEDVLNGGAIFRTSYKNRLRATGPNRLGRILSVVIGENPNRVGVFYVFSARPASRDEREEFRLSKGGTS